MIKLQAMAVPTAIGRMATPLFATWFGKKWSPIMWNESKANPARPWLAAG